MASNAAVGLPDEEGNPYAGWIVGTVVILAVLAIGAALWIRYHGL